MVDWQVFATVAVPILTLFLGAWVNRRFESRPVLLFHWGVPSIYSSARTELD